VRYFTSSKPPGFHEPSKRRLLGAEGGRPRARDRWSVFATGRGVSAGNTGRSEWAWSNPLPNMFDVCAELGIHW